jgi:hypothetical protein
MAGFIVPEEHDLASALIEIAEKHGKFNEDSTGIWAGYKPADQNEYKGIGVKCSNCVLYRGGSECAIIALPVEPEAKCRFAVIPDGVVNVTSADEYEENTYVTDYLDHEPIDIGDDVLPTLENSDEYEKRRVPISELIPTQRTVNVKRVQNVKDNHKPIIVMEDGDELKLVDGHHRTVYNYLEGEDDIKAKVYKSAVVATAGTRKAPKKDQIKGSKKNKEGSAATGKGVEFTASITKALENKVEDHNAKAKNGRKVNLRMLKAVYRRGAGAFSSSHRPDQNRNSWAMARVNAFLKLVKSGKPNNSKYVQDNDLLPKMHPRHSEASTMSPIMASLVAALDEKECPPATQDIAVNLANREKAIDAAKYGPLNPKEPNEEFWAEKAERWSLPIAEAKKSVCGNCVFFVRTPEMLDCIESGISAGDSGSENAWDAIDQAELGYCEAFDFKCAASRTCSAWAVGGPIT